MIHINTQFKYFDLVVSKEYLKTKITVHLSPSYVYMINTGVDVFGTGQAKVSINGSGTEVWWVSTSYIMVVSSHDIYYYILFSLSTLEQRAERLFSTKGILHGC